MTTAEKQKVAIQEIMSRHGLTAETAIEAIHFMLDEGLTPEGKDIDGMLRQFIEV